MSDPQTSRLNGSWAPRNPHPGPSPVGGGGRSQQNASARAGKTCLALGAWASIKLLIQPSECQHIISLPGRDQMVPTHPSLHFYLSGFHLDG